MLTVRARTRGFTLVELMVAMVLGLLVVVAALLFWMTMRSLPLPDVIALPLIVTVLAPTLVVSRIPPLETVTFPPIRFVCKVDELAFTGTEAVAVQSHAADR